MDRLSVRGNGAPQGRTCPKSANGLAGRSIFWPIFQVCRGPKVLRSPQFPGQVPQVQPLHFVLQRAERNTKVPRRRGHVPVLFIRGALPLGLPYTLSRAPLRRRAPFACLASLRSLAPCSPQLPEQSARVAALARVMLRAASGPNL